MALVVKTADAGRHRDVFDPWVKKIPWRARQPTPVLPGKFQGRGSRRATVHRVTKSQT